MMKLLSLALVMLPSLAYAETVLICENPRREYTVTYSPGAPNLAVSATDGETLYPVLVDDSQDGSHIVTADTLNNGPTARLHLRPYLKIEFWSEGQLVQTDGCYMAS